MRIASGVTDQYIYFVAVDSTDLKTRETGLSSFTVYRSRNGGAAAAYTTPTVNETDVTNMPGVYELLLDEDMTIDSGDETQEICLHITQASMVPVTRVIELYRPKITAGNTLDVTATGAAGIDWGNVENPTTAVDLSATDIQLCDTVTTLTGHTAQTGDSFARIGVAGAGLTNIDLPNQTMDIAGNITGSLSGSVGSVTGAVGSVTGNVGGNLTGTIGGMTAAALADFFDTDSGTTYAAAISGSVVSEIADNAGGCALTEAGIADAVWEEAQVDHTSVGTFGEMATEVSSILVDTGEIGTAGDGLTAIDLPDQTMNITGSLSGSVGSVTAGVSLAAGAVTDASLAGNMEIVFETDFATNYNTTRDAWVTNFADILGSYTAQTGDSFARLGAPTGASVSADITAVKGDTDAVLVDTADMQPKLGTPSGASMSADIAAVKAETALIVADTNELQTDWTNAGRLDNILDARAAQTTADAIETDTQDIQARLPAALVGGRMDSDVEAINNDTNAADHLAAHALTAVDVTFSAGGSTTTAVFNQVDGAGASSTNDVYNGRVLIFTAPAALKYQATDITDYDGGTLTATITAVTGAVGATATAILV